MIELNKAQRYYLLGGDPADEALLKALHNSGLIVYGAQAINAHLPEWLDKATEDWDIFSMTPEKTAKKLEKLLDKQYGGDFFKVEPAKHKGTLRIKNIITQRVVADITLPERTIDYKTIDNVNYATLEFQVESIKQVLANPAFWYRHARDTEALQRIQIYKRLHPLRKGRVRRLRTKLKAVPPIVIPITSEFRGIKD